MTAPLSSGDPGRTEFSHGKGRFAHPDSDYQTQRPELPWEVADRNQGSKRGGYTTAMRMQAELRSDPTNALELAGADAEPMLYEYGNPDMFGPGPKLVQESARRPSGSYKQPVVRYGVDRQR